MSLGPVMIDIEGTTLDADDVAILKHPLTGGVILFSRNFSSPAQLVELTQHIHGLRTPGLLIAVDQEGGRVQRFREGFTQLPAMASFGTIYNRDQTRAIELAEKCGWLMASELRAAGVDFSFAPVTDLRSSRSTVINDRAFHTDPIVVARLAQAFIRGVHSVGMAVVAKHFPGHGTVEADSHHELPVDGRHYEAIAEADLVPFKRLIEAGIEAIMPAHILYPKIDSVPAGFSPVWIGAVLRKELGFQGVVFSDDLSMCGAEGLGTYLERAITAISAGCDMVLVCNNREGAYAVLNGLDAQIEPMTRVRLMRMHARGKAPSFDSLRDDPKWLYLAPRISELTPSPELDLGDDMGA